MKLASVTECKHTISEPKFSYPNNEIMKNAWKTSKYYKILLKNLPINDYGYNHDDCNQNAGTNDND